MESNQFNQFYQGNPSMFHEVDPLGLRIGQQTISKNKVTTPATLMPEQTTRECQEYIKEMKGFGYSEEKIRKEVRIKFNIILIR